MLSAVVWISFIWISLNKFNFKDFLGHNNLSLISLENFRKLIRTSVFLVCLHGLQNKTRNFRFYFDSCLQQHVRCKLVLCPCLSASSISGGEHNVPLITCPTCNHHVCDLSSLVQCEVCEIHVHHLDQSPQDVKCVQVSDVLIQWLFVHLYRSFLLTNVHWISNLSINWYRFMFNITTLFFICMVDGTLPCVQPPSLLFYRGLCR